MAIKQQIVLIKVQIEKTPRGVKIYIYGGRKATGD
jgi:hypothetical protein